MSCRTELICSRNVGRAGSARSISETDLLLWSLKMQLEPPHTCPPPPRRVQGVAGQTGEVLMSPDTSSLMIQTFSSSLSSCDEGAELHPSLQLLIRTSDHSAAEQKTMVPQNQQELLLPQQEHILRVPVTQLHIRHPTS